LGELLGDGLGVPVGEPLGDGLGVPLGEPLGLGNGEPDGDGVGVTEPNVPVRTTLLPFLICIGIPADMNGTVCPSSVRTRKDAVPNELTPICPTTALFTEIASTVPAVRLIDEALTSSSLRPLSSTLYSENPAGETPPIGAPVKLAPMRVSLIISSALADRSPIANGTITHIATSTSNAPNLISFRFAYFFFIFITFLIP
jgi:hypothetical protein